MHMQKMTMQMPQQVMVKCNSSKTIHQNDSTIYLLHYKKRVITIWEKAEQKSTKWHKEPIVRRRNEKEGRGKKSKVNYAEILEDKEYRKHALYKETIIIFWCVHERFACE